MSRPIMTRTGGRSNGPDPRKIAMGAVTVLLIAGAAYAIMQFLPTKPNAADAKGPVGGTSGPASNPPPPRSLAPASTPTPATTPTPAPTPAPGPSGGSTFAPGDSPMVLNQGRGATNTPGGPGTTTNPGKPGPVDVTSPTLQPTHPGGIVPNGAGAPPPTLTPISSTANVRTLIDAGDRAMAANKLVEARLDYSRAYLHPDIGAADQQTLRDKLTHINDDLVFSSTVMPGDSLVESYTVASGDSLEKIRRKRDLATDWHLIARVNKISNPNALRVGQKVKLVRGPFNVVVHKADFRLDLFAGSPDDPASWLYIRSFKVGLGTDSGTPVGNFVIKNKMANPSWTNPVTGEKFEPNDPKNPIGEYWLGWQGVGDSKVYSRYGLHGTIDPTSIGQAKSMGCVRMANEDIAEVFELLVEQVSTVKVVAN